MTGAKLNQFAIRKHQHFTLNIKQVNNVIL